VSDPYEYRLSGLTLSSGIPLPELVPAPGTGEPADVHLSLGKTPASLEKSINSGVLYDSAPGQFLLHMPRIASYFVQNGNEIIIEPEAGSLEAEVRLFALGTVWAALLHQRGLLVLHASGIRTPEGAVIFLGRSSKGKSTLAAAFYRRGYPVLGDDTLAIAVKDGQALVYPGFPQLHLWPDMLAALGVRPDETIALRPKLLKHALPVPKGFSTQAQPVHAIYVLLSSWSDEAKLEKHHGMTGFSTLLQNSFPEKFLSDFGGKPVRFQWVNELARSVPVASLTRRESVLQFEQMMKLVEEDLGVLANA
jgi:hypothetical protein